MKDLDPAYLARLKKICKNVNDSVKGSAMTYLGSKDTVSIKRFSSSVPSLDEALGGGWPFGRLVELYGSESCGKTTLCLHAIAQFQKDFPDEFVAWIDSEASFDAEYAMKLGVDIRPICFSTPDTGEEAVNQIRQLLKDGVKLIVIDSVAALVPAVEREKAFGERTVGETARLMSVSLKQLAVDAYKCDSIMMFTNQVRDKIGVMYGDKTTTPGGRSLRHHCSIRLELRPMGFDKEGEKTVSVKIKATTKKNKTFSPMRVSEYNITFGIGVDAIIDIFNTGVEYGLIEKSGAWYSFEDKKIGQGKAQAVLFMRDNPDEFEKVKTQIAAIKASGKIPSQTLATTANKLGKKVKMPKLQAADKPREEIEEDGEASGDDSGESLDLEPKEEVAEV